MCTGRASPGSFRSEDGVWPVSVRQCCSSDERTRRGDASRTWSCSVGGWRPV